jgi:hypothetical protein
MITALRKFLFRMEGHGTVIGSWFRKDVVIQGHTYTTIWRYAEGGEGRLCILFLNGNLYQIGTHVSILQGTSTLLLNGVHVNEYQSVLREDITPLRYWWDISPSILTGSRIEIEAPFNSHIKRVWNLDGLNQAMPYRSA